MKRESFRCTARRAFGHHRSMRRKWFEAVRYLRTQSKRGWIVDQKVARVEIKPNPTGVTL